jgi:MFS family permease
LLAVALMILWAGDFRAVFWFAVLPGAVAVLLLWAGVEEPAGAGVRRQARNPLGLASLAEFDGRYWLVVAAGAVFTLARFSEAFLILRAHEMGLAQAYTPLVLVAMNLVYALSAYPAGRLADSASHRTLLAWGLVVLAASDVVLAAAGGLGAVAAGVALWGLHMGLTQGLLATMVAAVAPAHLRGTAFGIFNLACGVAMLAASVIAGWLWDRLGAPATFAAGAGFALAALVLLRFRARGRAARA